MTSIALRKKTHQYIEMVDDKILKAVFTILESHVQSTDIEFGFTLDQVKELNKRRKDHLENKSKSYSAEGVKKAILTKLKK